MNKINHKMLLLKTDPHSAFRFFTEKKLLQNWLTAIADVEPVVGGKYELFWDPENTEDNSTIGCKITAIERDKLIAFEWKSPKQFKQFANSADPLTHVVISFIPIEDLTEIHLVHSGWRNTPEWEEARIWQERAWKVAFNNLSDYFKEIRR